MGSMCASLFGSSASTSYSANPQVETAFTDILNRAATQSNQPYPQYTPATAAQFANYNPGLVAPMDPNQVQAGQNISGLQGYTSPYFQAATGLAGAAATPMQMQQFSQPAINQYMNPYMNDVVNSAVANINQTNAQQQQQVLGNSVQQGAFGGDRAGIAQADLARQQNLSNNATISNLLGQGYSQAQNEFNTQQQTDLATQLQNRQLMANAGLNLANLGTQGQAAALQQAQAQYGYGTAEQQQQQAGLSTAYQQYLQQQAYPYQQLSYYAGLASGAAPAMGGTTTGYSPTYSPYNALSAIGSLGSINAAGGSVGSGIGSVLGGAGSAVQSVFPALNTGGRVNYDRGGRTGYAAGGTPATSDSIIQAYQNYEQLAANPNVSKTALDSAYQNYLDLLQSPSTPWTNAPTSTTPASSSSDSTLPKVPAFKFPEGGPNTGSGGGANFHQNITAQNAEYSPDATSSNGPVGGGGYGPYDSGGGQGNAFNWGGPLGGLVSGIAATLEGTSNQNKTPTETGYTGVVSQAPVESANAAAASDVAPHYVGPNTADLGASTTSSVGNNDTTSGVMSAIRQVETGGVANPNTAIGDGGKALGAFQMHDSAAADAAKSLGISYDSSMRADPTISAQLAQEHLSNLFNYTGSVPDAIAAYNMGLGAYNAAISAGQDPTQGAYTQKVLATGLVDPNAGISPPMRYQTPEGVVVNAQSPSVPLPPSNPAYSTALAGIAQQQTADQSTENNAAPSAASEGHSPMGVVSSPDSGNIGLDRSVGNDQGGSFGGQGNGPSVQSSSDKSGSFGGQGNSPSVQSSSDKSGSFGGQGNSPFVSDHESEKRGGFIRAHDHHYDSGGYVPISMNYGMPDQNTVKQIAQDYAGSGAGVLSPMLEALGTSGLVGANKGGRIHAANGTGISDSGPMRPVDESDPDSTGYVPDMGTTDATANQPLPDDFRAAPDPSNVNWDNVKLSTFSAPVIHGILPGIKHEYDPDLENRNRVSVPVDVTDVESRKNAGIVPSEPATSAPVKTQPIIPRVRPDEGGGGSSIPPVVRNRPNVADLAATGDDEVETTTQQNASAQRVPNNVVAQDATRTMSDAAQPGFGYIAPPPMDKRQLANIAFWAAGATPGANIGNSANAYANAILAGQGQERETMTTQAQSAKDYGQANLGNATAGLTRAEEELKRLTPNPFGGNALFTTGTPENPQYKYVDMPQPNQAGGQQAAGATPAGNAPAALGDVLNEKAATLDQYANSLKKQVGNSIYSPDTVKNLKGEYQGYADETNKAAQIANTSLGDASTMAHDLVVAQQYGWGTMGAGSAFRLATIRAAATAARVAGYNVSDDPVVASQELQKIARLMANQQAGSVSHNAAARTIDATEAALPGAALEPEAANKVFTSLMRQNVMARDAQQATNYFGGKTARMGNPEQAIQAAYPPDQYNREQNALQDLMSPDLSWKNAKGKNVNLVTELMDGHYTRAQFDAKVNQYYPDVKHLSRWLVN